jgi:hypothetical protein
MPLGNSKPEGQSWQQSSQASPKLRFGLLGVFLEVDLACLLDDVVIGDLIWELIEGLTGLFQKQKEKFVQTITVLGEL